MNTKKSGIYQMRCMDYPLKYMRQTSQTFQTGYKGHIQAIRNNNGNSVYSNHIINTGHAYRNTTDTMKVIKIEKKKEKHINTLEKYHIYKMSKDELNMNDTYIDAYNPIFKVM
jgi:hypothetical protein